MSTPSLLLLLGVLIYPSGPLHTEDGFHITSEADEPLLYDGVPVEGGDYTYEGSGGIVFGGAALTSPGLIFSYTGSGGIILGGLAETAGGPIWSPQPPVSGGWAPLERPTGPWAPATKPTGPWVPVGG